MTIAVDTKGFDKRARETPRNGAEARVLLRNISWPLFQAIAESKGDDRNPRLTYVDGSLELMSPSFPHENLTRRLGNFVLMLCRGLGWECVDGGSTRWEKTGIEKSKEPDCSFYLANEPLVRGMKDINLDESPAPDLAVEVVIAHPLADAFKVYAALCVPEVWTYDGDSPRFFHLGVDGSYVERDSSLGFPMLRSEEARERLATADEMSLVRWTVAIEEWARRELATR